MALPTARTPGFTTFQTLWGPRTACECLAQWLPAFARRLGVSVEALQITQLTGGASASAGTHSQGGAADLLSTDREWVRIAREMGAAAWVRTRAQGFDVDHIHLVLNGCPHNGPARYQIDALARGRNGLANNGPDPGPGPRKLRTWSQGIAWALGVNANPPSATPAAKQGADLMPAILYRAEKYKPVVAVGGKFWALENDLQRKATEEQTLTVWLTAKTLDELIKDARKSKTPDCAPVVVRCPGKQHGVYIAHGGAVDLANRDELENVRGIPGCGEFHTSDQVANSIVNDIRKGTNR